jgi:hypothetical protein
MWFMRPLGDLLFFVCARVSGVFSDSYLQLVLEYLITWYQRAKPLTNVDGLLKEVQEDLEKRWDGSWSWERAEREEKDREHEKIKSENSAASSVRIYVLCPAFARSFCAVDSLTLCPHTVLDH